jgi:hypothetical protein
MRKFYKHHVVEKHTYGMIFTKDIAWVNRITERDAWGKLTSERWLIMLPNWNYAYQPCCDDYRWSQRYVSWCTVKGGWRSGWFEVQDL